MALHPLSRWMGRLLLAGALAGSAIPGAGAAPATPAAAPAAPEPFGVSTWAQLQREVRGATWVVFSASDCSHCPAVLERLRRATPQMPLWWVQTDAGEAEVPAGVARALSFGDGHALALRHGVNPAWPGMTPYLALLRPGLPPLFALGQPSPAQLKAAAPAAGKARQIQPSH